MQGGDKESVNRKKILWVVGVVGLGALGSAVWELAKPLLGWAWIGLLTIATLGLGSLRDNLYTTAANSLGNGRPIGLASAVQMLGATIMLAVATIILCFQAVFPDRPLIKAARLGMTLLLYLMIFGSVAMMVGGIENRYREELASYYAKLETIAAPFISDREMKELRSKSAQSIGRKQYLEQIEKLQRLIRENGIQPPIREFF